MWKRGEVSYPDNDSMVVKYIRKGMISRKGAIDELVEWGIFARCGHTHDCCGCWFAHWVSEFTHESGNTVVSIHFSQNV